MEELEHYQTIFRIKTIEQSCMHVTTRLIYSEIVVKFSPTVLTKFQQTLVGMRVN